MNNDKRYEGKRDFQPRQPRQEVQSPDEVVAKDERWLPTPEVFAAFQVRDEYLCQGNLRRIMKGSGEMTFRDIKEQLLHSAETIERLLARFVKDGSVKEGTGKFGPTFMMAGR